MNRSMPTHRSLIRTELAGAVLMVAALVGAAGCARSSKERPAPDETAPAVVATEGQEKKPEEPAAAAAVPSSSMRADGVAPAEPTPTGRAARASKRAEALPPPGAGAGRGSSGVGQASPLPKVKAGEDKSEPDLGGTADKDQQTPRRSSPIDPARENSERMMSDLLGAFNQLELSLSAPDCVTAAVFRDRVCELAERICRLADEHRAAESDAQCGDGRERCVQARRRYELGCPTP
jgi:hypothetical protein